jgi:hypothetical protein
MKKIAYLGLDVHARNCVLGNMDDSGTFCGNREFTTSENNIINALNSIKTKVKYLASVICYLSSGLWFPHSAFRIPHSKPAIRLFCGGALKSQYF